MEGEKDLEKLSPELQEKSLDQIDLSDFFAELEEYHAEFNLGALMGSRSINLIEKRNNEKIKNLKFKIIYIYFFFFFFFIFINFFFFFFYFLIASFFYK